MSLGITSNIFLKKERIALLMIFFVIFTIHVWRINDFYLPFVLDDEFGYWSIAAYFAGLDWSSATSHIAYYSYGYSVLLTPLFWIFDDPIIRYRAALVINSVLLSLIPIISFNIAKRLFSKTDKILLLFVSICVSLYSSYIVFANVAWSESLLIFMCWMIVWCFLDINKNTSIWKFLLIGFLLVYAYTIHQRALGVLVAGIIVILIMKFSKHLTWKQASVFSISIVSFFTLHIFIKREIVSNVWLNSFTSTKNDYSSQVSKIESLFTLNGLYKTFSTLSGQLFYIGASSYLMCYIGMIYLIIGILKPICCRRLNKDISFRELVCNNKSVHFFLALSFLATLLISVISMNNPNRLDHIVYGRYVEMILGPLILIGIISLFENTKRMLVPLILSSIVIIISGMITKQAIISLGSTAINPVTSVGTWNFFSEGSYKIFTLSIITIVGAFVLWGSFILKNKTKMLTYAVLSVICFLFIFMGKKVLIDGVIPVHQSFVKSNNIVKYIKNQHGGNNKSVYFLLEDTFDINSSKDLFQFLLGEKPLICVNNDQLSKLTGDRYVITSNPNPLSFPNKSEYSLKYAIGSYFLWGAEDNIPNQSGEIELPLSLFNTLNGKIYTDGVTYKYIESDGTANFLLYGPYMRLEEGKYFVNFDLELLSSSQEELGYIDIVSGDRTLIKQPFSRSSINDDHLLTVKLPVEIEETKKNIEFRIFTNSGVNLQVKQVSLFSEEY
ncbi:hypothetical protein ACE3MQ_12670 [Paenibacillus lentus]|uniref:hypothetical protein n=1 Tax=Paenibacillus lentus TaxID=1338368 RepID=UPI003653617C